jgi:hypothetical protein
MASKYPGTTESRWTKDQRGYYPTTEAAPPAARRRGGSGGGGSSKNKKAAGQLLEIGQYNAGSVTGQLDKALGDYDLADRQNQGLADVQFEANSKQSAADRFAQAKKLQSSTRGILGAAGNALQGSQLGSLAGMIRDRTDLDTGEVLGTLTQNQNSVRNTLNESRNANTLARRDLMTNAEFALRGLEADTAAQLATLDPKLYKKPGSGVNLGSAAAGARRNTVAENKAMKSGYFLPDATPQAQPVGLEMQGNSYFDKLLNAYNQRRA